MPTTLAARLRAAALCATLAACGRPADGRIDSSAGALPAAGGAPPSGAPACSLPQAPAGTRVLAFSRTRGWRHSSIPNGKAALLRLGAEHGFAVDTTEDAGRFTEAGLRGYRAVVFLNTTGDVLDAAQQAAFERFVRAGGGFAGVHSASDTEYDWPWYGRLVGAYFASHPANATAAVNVVDRRHASTRCLPARWTRLDEWYDFKAAPPAGVTILATLDETTYAGGRMGANHPIAWYHEFDGGRAWYTAMGHTEESYAERGFLDHLAGGVLWAAGAAR